MQKGPKQDQSPATGALKRLPAVARLLASPSLSEALRRYGTPLVTELLRERLDELRGEILGGHLTGLGPYDPDWTLRGAAWLALRPDRDVG